jgi:hypothetical protein
MGKWISCLYYSTLPLSRGRSNVDTRSRYVGEVSAQHDFRQKWRCAQAGFRSCQRDDGLDQFHGLISPDFGLSSLLSCSCVSPSLRK